MDGDTDLHRVEVRASFGDCDPAGIVFYPNLYRWIDAAFHDYLDRFGGHATLCARLGAVGLGLIETSARYHRPLRPGDRATVAICGIDWAERSLAVSYEIRVDAGVAVRARETRGVFVARDHGLSAGPVAPLRAALRDPV